MDTLLQDLRYAIRSLRRTPGFTLTVIAVMALGIGVNSMIYTVVRGILFADLPFAHPERMVRLEATGRREFGEMINLSLPDLRDVQSGVPALRGVSGWYQWTAFVTAGDEPQRYQATMASAGLPEALGARPQQGRWFTAAECRTGANLVPIVIGDQVWREQLHADPHVLGRTLRVNGRVRTIVGVMPRGFRFPENSDLFTPLAMDDSTAVRGQYYLEALARLAPGATRQQAEAQLASLSRRLQAAYKDTNNQLWILALDYRQELVHEIRPMMVLLTLAVTFVLLIACANVANLLLARGTARRREVGVRVALGASRGRIVRQVLTESLLLSLSGGALGVLLGNWGMRVTLASIPVPLPYWMRFDLDPVVLTAVVALSVLSGLVFGLAPALHVSAGDLLTPLREGTPGGGHSRGHQRMRAALVVSEVALAMVLLIGSGLMIRSFLHQLDERLSLRTQGVLTGTLTLPVALYPDDARQMAFFREFRAALLVLPGVRSAGAVLNLHLGSGMWRMSVQREGLDPDGNTGSQNPHVSFNAVTPGYLDAVGLRLIRGRDVMDADVAGSPRVALVNEAAARELWPHADPIGRRWRFGPDDKKGWATVVGVVANVRQNLRATGSGLSEILVPLEQFPNQTVAWAVRSTAPPEALTSAVRSLLRRRDPNLVFADAQTLDQHVRVAVWEPRIYAQLMGVFSLVALVIAALGIYGVMAYMVAQRTREIGIRMALGAAREDVQRLVMGQAVRLTMLGAGLGLALAYALTRFMQSQLSGIRADDPPTFVGVTLILALSSAAAAWLPTARAVRVDPVVALRHE